MISQAMVLVAMSAPGKASVPKGRWARPGHVIMVVMVCVSRYSRKGVISHTWAWSRGFVETMTMDRDLTYAR